MSQKRPKENRIWEYKWCMVKTQRKSYLNLLCYKFSSSDHPTFSCLTFGSLSIYIFTSSRHHGIASTHSKPGEQPPFWWSHYSFNFTGSPLLLPSNAFWHILKYDGSSFFLVISSIRVLPGILYTQAVIFPSWTELTRNFYFILRAD